MKKPNSFFYRWWNSYTGRRVVATTYSIGASIVILGALFKMLHLPYADIMLGVGMCAESFIFALGSFDKPYREYDWNKIFDFKAEPNQKISANNLHSIGNSSQNVKTIPTHTEQDNPILNTSEVSANISFPTPLSTEDLQKLSEGITNLTKTANSLQTLADLALSTNSLAESIQAATQTATHFKESQQNLNQQTETLATAYQTVNGDMHTVIHNTKNYATSINNINNNIENIQTSYQLQNEHLQQQTQQTAQQIEKTQSINTCLDTINSELQQVQNATQQTLTENKKYQAATEKMTQQVESLNAIYGNMLNALS